MNHSADIEELRARVKALTNLNTRSKSRRWLLDKLEQVCARRRTHATIARLARGRKRKD